MIIFLGMFWHFFTNIKPSWKSLPGTKALVYLASLLVTEKNSFIILTPVLEGLQSHHPSRLNKPGNQRTKAIYNRQFYGRNLWL